MKVTTELASSQARALRDTLASNGIDIRHTKALDLVCAAHGLRSRNVLAASPEGDGAPNVDRLMAVAAGLATHDAARLSSILSATTALTHPARTIALETAFGERFGRRYRFALSADMPRVVDQFLGTEGGGALVAELASGYYHNRHHRDRSDRSMSLKTGSLLAERLLTRGEDSYVEEILEGVLGEGTDAWESFAGQNPERVDALVEAVDEELREAGLPGLERRDEWVEGLREAVVERLEGEDDSKASDLLDEWDRAEVVFVFGDPTLGCEDNALTAGGVTMTAGDVVPDEALRATLAGIGYTLGEYRKLSGNRAPTRGALSRSRVRKGKVVPWEAVRSALDEACSSYCNLVLYAQVPVEDLVDLDPRRPMRFSRAAFASYNCMSGTFFDSATVDDVVVDGRHGFLASCHGWYGPDEICGLVSSHYEGRVGNVEPQGGEAA